jgi:hypothetical protein
MNFFPSFWFRHFSASVIKINEAGRKHNLDLTETSEQYTRNKHTHTHTVAVCAPYSDCVASLSLTRHVNFFLLSYCTFSLCRERKSSFNKGRRGHGGFNQSLSLLFFFLCSSEKPNNDATKCGGSGGRERERVCVCYFFVCDGQIDTGALTWHWWKRAGSLTQCSSFTRRRRAYRNRWMGGRSKKEGSKHATRRVA